VTQEVAEPQDNRALDRRLAYALLRLTLGINIFVHGAVRLPALGTFVEGMVRQFADTPLPGVAVRLFALSLPLLEAGVGLLLIVGLWTPTAPDSAPTEACYRLQCNRGLHPLRAKSFRSTSPSLVHPDRPQGGRNQSHPSRSRGAPYSLR